MTSIALRKTTSMALTSGSLDRDPYGIIQHSLKYRNRLKSMQILLSRTQAEGQTEQISKSRNKFLESDSEREVEGARRSFPLFFSLSLQSRFRRRRKADEQQKTQLGFALNNVGRDGVGEQAGRQASGGAAGGAEDGLASPNDRAKRRRRLWDWEGVRGLLGRDAGCVRPGQ